MTSTLRRRLLVSHLAVALVGVAVLVGIGLIVGDTLLNRQRRMNGGMGMRPDTTSDAVASILPSVLIVGGLAAVIAAGVAAVLVTRSIMGPLSSIQEASRRIADGDYAQRVPTPRGRRTRGSRSRHRRPRTPPGRNGGAQVAPHRRGSSRDEDTHHHHQGVDGGFARRSGRAGPRGLRARCRRGIPAPAPRGGPVDAVQSRGAHPQPPRIADRCRTRCRRCRRENAHAVRTRGRRACCGGRARAHRGRPSAARAGPRQPRGKRARPHGQRRNCHWSRLEATRRRRGYRSPTRVTALRPRNSTASSSASIGSPTRPPPVAAASASPSPAPWSKRTEAP